MSAYAVITPVYEDQVSFDELCKRIEVLERGSGTRYYVIAIDDGSLAAPPLIGSLTKAGISGEIMRLARNVGHQTAIAIGLARATAIPGLAGCVIMDSDGEDRPEDIPRLIDAIVGGDVDIAVAQRARRSETILFRMFYGI